MNLKKILKEEATWYFLALAGLLILLYMGANVIIDTYFYMISLNILILLFSYIILKIKNIFQVGFSKTNKRMSLKVLNIKNTSKRIITLSVGLFYL